MIAGWLFKGMSFKQTASRLLLCILVLFVSLTVVICTLGAVRWIDKPFPGFLVNQRMAIGVMGQPHWTGIRAGLMYPDKILKADGKDISSLQDLEAAVRQVNVGEYVRYTVEREGQVFETAVQTMRFTRTDFLMTFGIVSFLGIIYFAMGTVVFILKPDSAVGQVFLLACTLQGVSSIVSFDIEGTHLGFIRVFLFCEAFLSAAVIHLSLLFPEKQRLLDKRPFIAAVPYILSSFLLVALQISYPHPPFLFLFQLDVLYFTLSVAMFLAFVIRAYLVRRGSVLARERAKVILIGAILAMPVPALVPFLAIIGKTVVGVKIPTNLSSIPMILFPFSIAYAIAKHNLFDVDVYLKRGVGYAIMTGAVGLAYFATQLIVESIVLGPIFGKTAEKMYPVVFALIVVFLFNPLNRWVQGAVDRLFYRKKYDYKETVTAVSNALTSVLNLDEIVRKIVHTVQQEMFIDTSGVVMVSPGGAAIRGYFAGEPDSREGREEATENKRRDQGKEKDEIRTVAFHQNDPVISLVSREKKLVTKYDVAEGPHFASVRQSCGSRFAELGASMAVPIVFQGKVKGILVVGHKMSGHFFNREDVELLQTLASHGAVAIENANLADQMKKEEVVRANLSRYLSPQIVDRIVRHDVQVNLGGDRKVVTVLFTDIRNFTTITEGRPPDQLVHILNEYFTEMAGVIFENLGSLDKYIGDAVVAVFGSLIPLENPARNAVTAAVEMMRKMAGLNRHWEARYAFSMNIGIGVSTGEVFLGNIGSPERMEFTVIGDAVNVASRFSGLARGGQILVTKTVAESVGDVFRLGSLPPAEVKGKTGKMEVFEVLYAQSVS